MALTRDDVRHLARLARLELAEDELTELSQELGRIVDYVAELAQVDTSAVVATTSIGPVAAPLRADVPAHGLPREAALGEAPRAAAGAFAVPEFIDES